MDDQPHAMSRFDIFDFLFADHHTLNQRLLLNDHDHRLSDALLSHRQGAATHPRGQQLPPQELIQAPQAFQNNQVVPDALENRTNQQADQIVDHRNGIADRQYTERSAPGGLAVPSALGTEQAVVQPRPSGGITAHQTIAPKRSSTAPSIMESKLRRDNSHQFPGESSGHSSQIPMAVQQSADNTSAGPSHGQDAQLGLASDGRAERYVCEVIFEWKVAEPQPFRSLPAVAVGEVTNGGSSISHRPSSEFEMPSESSHQADPVAPQSANYDCGGPSHAFDDELGSAMVAPAAGSVRHVPDMLELDSPEPRPFLSLPSALAVDTVPSGGIFALRRASSDFEVTSGRRQAPQP